MILLRFPPWWTTYNVPLQGLSKDRTLVNGGCFGLIRAMQETIALRIGRYAADQPSEDRWQVALDCIQSDDFTIHSVHLVCNTDNACCIVLCMSVSKFDVCIVIPHYRQFDIDELDCSYDTVMSTVQDCIRNALEHSWQGALTSIGNAYSRGGVYYKVKRSGTGFIDPAVMISQSLHEDPSNLIHCDPKAVEIDENDLTIHDKCDWNDDDDPPKWDRPVDYLKQSYPKGKALGEVFADKDVSTHSGITLEDALDWAISAVEGPPRNDSSFCWKVTGEYKSKVIYGQGGWHRYFVKGNEVVFSARHSNAEGIAKAEKVGFRIWR